MALKPVLEALVEGVEPYPLMTSQMLYEAPPVPYIIEGVLQRGGIVGLTGFPGTGKTWLAMEMMQSLITGSPFLGHFPAKVCPVLFVGQDASVLDYARQWTRLTRHRSVEIDEQNRKEGLQESNPYNTYAHFMLQTEFNLDDPTQIARLVKTSQRVWTMPHYDTVLRDDGWETVELQEQHYGLIILDTLSKLTRTPENDNTARDLVFNNLRDIAEATGATLLVLHHNSLQSEFRTGEEWRGAGSQFGALDVHFHLTARKKELVEFKVKKFRGITPPPFEFHLDVHTSEDSIAKLSWLQPSATKEDSDERTIMDIVSLMISRGNKPLAIADMAIALMSDTALKYADEFDNDGKKFKNHLANVLSGYVKLPAAKIIHIGNRGPRGSGLYKLTPEVAGEGSTSTGTDSDGTAESGGEAQGVAG